MVNDDPVAERRAKIARIAAIGTRLGYLALAVSIVAFFVGLATDWPAIGSDLPRDLLKSGVPMSGLYDLGPLRETEINDAVGLDAATARDYSPLFKKPATLAPVLATLGGGETTQFHRQTDRFVEGWTKHGVRIERFAQFAFLARPAKGRRARGFPGNDESISTEDLAA